MYAARQDRHTRMALNMVDSKAKPWFASEVRCSIMTICNISCGSSMNDFMAENNIQIFPALLDTEPEIMLVARVMTKDISLICLIAVSLRV